MITSSLVGPLLGGSGSSLPGALVAAWGQITKNLLTSVVAWGDGKVLVVQFTPAIASGDVVGDEYVLGPLYMRAGYLVANDGENEAVYATSWAAGDVVTAFIQTDTDNTFRIGRLENM